MEYLFAVYSVFSFSHSEVDIAGPRSLVDKRVDS